MRCVSFRKSMILACLSLCFLVPAATRAQYKEARNSADPMHVGSVILNLGIGAGAPYRYDYYNQPFGTKMAVEWGLFQAGPGVISLGPEIGGSFSSGGYYNDYRSRTIVVAGRSAWHYGWKVRGLDTYAGLSLGIGFHHEEYISDADYVYNETIPVFGGFVGASYFLSQRFGFNAEAGYDITNFQVGVVFRLK